MNRTIDTHVHVWDLERAAYDWLEGDQSLLNATWNLQQLDPHRKAAGITHGVLVQAAPNLDDTALMLETAAAHDWIVGSVVWLPLQDPQQTQRLLEERFAGNEFVSGVRHQIHDEPDEKWLLQPQVIESLGILAGKNIPFDVVAINTAHIDTALRVAEKLPHLRMIFDHLAQPPIHTGSMGKWKELMTAAAAHPGCYAKISGLGTASKNFNSWHVDDLRPYIDFVLDTFSPSRCCCGGDWPVALLAGSYEQIWSAYRSILQSSLSKNDYERVMHGTATDFYSLNIPALVS